MKLKSTFTVLLIGLISIISLSFKYTKSNNYHPLRSNGAAAAFNAGYTGAPFDNGGSKCSPCHGGGIYNPTVDITVLNSANNPVNHYVAGVNYTVRLAIIASTGSPKFGFQLMAVKSSDNSNLNTWGSTFPLDVKNTLTGGGRNYIEHNARLNNGIIDIPWTAPSAGSGAIHFYGIGNAVDGTGGTGGDVAVSTDFEIVEGTLPINLLSFTGKEENGKVKLSWETAQEINNEYFNIEHSLDGNNFKIISKVISKGNTSTGHTYAKEDNQNINGVHFYRLKQVDVDGKFTYSAIVMVKLGGKKMRIYPNPVTNEINFNSGDILKNTQYKIVNQTGKLVLSGNLNANKINVATLANGTYFVSINNDTTILLSEKFVKQ